MDSLSVILNVAGGICLLTFWYGYAFLLPFKMLKDGVWHLAVHSRWTPINLFGVAGTVLASTGLIVTVFVHQPVRYQHR